MEWLEKLSVASRRTFNEGRKEVETALFPYYKGQALLRGQMDFKTQIFNLEK